MERETGSIIGIGGMAAITGRPDTSTVTAAKTGLWGFIRAVAGEFAPYNIRANMVNPGTIDTTRRNPEWFARDSRRPTGNDEQLRRIPLRRQGTIYDIANACLFLASDESSYITGDQLNVCGRTLPCSRPRGLNLTPTIRKLSSIVSFPLDAEKVRLGVTSKAPHPQCWVSINRNH